jgi:O-antigen ligase
MSAMAARREPAPVSRPTPILVIGCVVAAAVAAGGLAQLGIKGLILIFAGLALTVALLLVKHRPLFTLLVMVASFQVLFHKSVGPINVDTSGGAPAVYITSIDALLLVLYGFWAASGTLARDLRANLGRPIFVVPALGIVAVVPSFLASQDLWLSFSELVRMLWMYALYVYVALRLRDGREARFLVLTLFAIAAVQFVIVLLQWHTGSSLGLSFLGEESTLGVRTLDDGEIPRPTGTVVHADFLASLVAPVGLLAFSFAVGLRDRPWLRRISLLMLPIAAAPLVISQTRAAFVGFGVAFALLVGWNVLRRNLRVRTVLIAGAIALAAAIPFYEQIRTRVFDNLGTAQFQKEVQSRVELNDLAVTMFLDHPLVGVGLNNFVLVEADYDTYGLIFAGNPVHDIYLLVLSETGVVGFAGFGATAVVVVLLAMRVARSRDPVLGAIGSGIAASMVFFAVEEVLTFSLRQDMPLALMWLLAGVAAACARMLDEERVPGHADTATTVLPVHA